MHQKHLWDTHNHRSTTFLVSGYPGLPRSPASPLASLPVGVVYFSTNYSLSAPTSFPYSSKKPAPCQNLSLFHGAILSQRLQLCSELGPCLHLQGSSHSWLNDEVYGKGADLIIWPHPLSAPSGLSNPAVGSSPGMLESGSFDQKHLYVKIKAPNG